MAENRWEGFEDELYELIDIGRPAVFLIPDKVLTPGICSVIEKFLKETYGGFQRPKSLVSGVYTTADGDVALDDCVQYEVSFKGKDRIPELARMLTSMALHTGQEAIYLKCGQYAALLKPKSQVGR